MTLSIVNMTSSVFGRLIIDKISLSLHWDVDQVEADIALDMLQIYFNSDIISHPVNAYVKAVIAHDKRNGSASSRHHFILGGEQELEIQRLKKVLTPEEMSEAHDIWLAFRDDHWKAVDEYFKFFHEKKGSQFSQESIATEITQNIIKVLALQHPARLNFP